ncbi:hydrogenase expression/formation protein HypE [Clostridium grantii]|uniref:Hydrogenase maturation protein, carbamoyl dehydratase HypE n=1 Tax=Clostridium grantii DSM 8605 TaxID=1121316 RepID=A0A1M5VP18_9CLOT|nr:hydrogenase expression/formation protein HypE [Clostridium grantii]SHH77002.1 Hydrogenase maturation protein, carbamoyl dehydratase HypE [Clostridium grantii DSM 8605]
MNKKIELKHGDGGLHTNKLIKDIFYRNFNNEILLKGRDSALIDLSKINNHKLAYTTDSYVVKPIFFPGGNIGSLAVCGTINDLTAAGATPYFLSVGFIIEEGFEIEKLNLIASTMGDICKNNNVRIVTGDTKVVEKNSLDQIFINTSGVGFVKKGFKPRQISIGDEIIVTGSIGDHGTVIGIERFDFGVDMNLKSDCAALNNILYELHEFLPKIKLMKDPTRGGIATILNEIANDMVVGVTIHENKIPIKNEVKGITELLGLDPYYLACEGRMILIVEKGYGNAVVNELRKLHNCKNSQIIGIIENSSSPYVCLETRIGGKRLLHILEESMLPRIC